MRYAAIAMIVLYAVAIYVAIGFVAAAAFVTIGVTQVVHCSLTVGARILLLPGATVFWPYILGRWLKSYRTP
jgi:hypothetical protein